MKKTNAILLLILAVAVVYAPAAWNGFVWDDTALVLRDPLIRSWRLIPEGFNHFLFTDATASDFYRPIQRLVYTIDYAGFAFRPAAYHLTNIFWHAAAVVALFIFAEELLLAFGLQPELRRRIALLAALAWAVHPVHTAAVIYVSGLADPLAATFGFAGCYMMMRGVREDGRAQIFWILGSGPLFLLSALSKEVGFILLAAAFVLLALLKKWTAMWKLSVVALFVGAIYFSLRSGAEHFPPPETHKNAAIVRPITMARAVAEYAGLLVLPTNLHMDRQLDVRGPGAAVIEAAAWRELQTAAGIALIALAIFWAIRARKRNPLVFALLLLTGLTYLPISGIRQLNGSVAEHWIYIPSAFLFLAFGVVIAELAARREWPRTARVTLSIVLAAWCAFLAGRTFLRNFDWKDQRTFLETSIAHGGNSVRMLTNLGGLELREGHLDLAKKHLQAALGKDPDEPFAVINLAGVALKENDFKGARELLKRAVQMPEVEARAYENLAVLENKEHGRADLMRIRLASRTGPPDWSIEKRYILLLDETGSTAAAMKEIDYCLATKWYRAETWQLLGELLQKSGRVSEGSVALARARAFDVHLDDK